jgi:AcrR family transcriptional regulator
MAQTEQSARQRILEATIELLQTEGAQGATVRAIAKRAGVGIGLINYHFGAKEELISRAVMAIIGASPALSDQGVGRSQVDPETRLRQLVRDRGRIMARFPELYQIALRYELMEGDFSDAHSVTPLLREIFGSHKRELDLRLLAFALMASLQVALLRPQAFGQFSGMDITKEEQRELVLEVLVNNLLAQKQAGS